MSQEGPAQIPVYDIHQTHHPFINIKQNLLNQPIADVRRSIASFNPFATRQVPSQDRMGLGFRWGNQFYSPNVYPNGIYFNNMFPSHYDPLSAEKRPDGTYQDKNFAPAEHGILALTADKLPRGCVRQLDTYRRCEWVNGQDKCQQEQQNIINICPNWALDEMKQKSRLIAKVNAIQNITYRRSMELSEYNKGRNVSHVTDKTWVHGTRHHLRPDTMYPDERYANITQQEINEAKQRVAARAQQQEVKEAEPAKDRSFISFKKEKPLYP